MMEMSPGPYLIGESSSLKVWIAAIERTERGLGFDIRVQPRVQLSREQGGQVVADLFRERCDDRPERTRLHYAIETAKDAVFWNFDMAVVDDPSTPSPFLYCLDGGGDLREGWTLGHMLTQQTGIAAITTFCEWGLFSIPLTRSTVEVESI